MPPETCPNCGAAVPPTSKACPQCGSDDTTGWSEEARYAGLGLPDEEFDYNEFVRKEFRGEKPIPCGLHWFWWLIALIILAVFVCFWVIR